MPDPAVTYASYLNVEELLACQKPRSAGPEHDEMLFIIIHQVYELWFKEIIHELDHLKAALVANDTPVALHTLRRILTIMKTLVGQVDILETMTPLSFNSFRGRLESASGFQSSQFREFEFVLGHRSRHAIANQPEGSPARRRLERRLGTPALFDCFLAFLAANGYDVPDEVLARNPDDAYGGDERVQQSIIEVYRYRPGAGRRLRAARRPRRRHPGMALPAREDGRAHDRHQAGDGRIGRRGIPAHHAVQAALSGPVGDSPAPVR